MTSATGVSRDAIMERSRAIACSSILPYHFSDGNGVVQLWFLPFTEGFRSVLTKLEQNGWLNTGGLCDQEILNRLEMICDGRDDRWNIRAVDFTEQGELWVWFDRIDNLNAAMKCDNCLKLEIGQAEGLTVQLRQSLSLNVAPHLKSLIKVSNSKITAQPEWIIDCWMRGYGHNLYRINPVDVTKQTVEYYPPHVDLFIEKM